jgi:hypothetical protein
MKKLQFRATTFICDHFDIVYYFQGFEYTSNEEMYRKLAEIYQNIVMVLIDTDDSIGTVNTVSIFYSYLFDFSALFSNIFTIFHG